MSSLKFESASEDLEKSSGASSDYRFAPASVGQASLWFLRQVMPYKSPYNTSVQFRLSGPLDSSAFLKAAREIVQRHESCRTTFRAIEGRLFQSISEKTNADVSFIDMVTSPNAEAQANQLARAIAAEPFDLAHGPLVRIHLIQIALRDHLLVVVMDHIVADGMSLGIIWKELEVIYPAFVLGKPSPLPPVKKQYAEFVAAQNAWMETPAFARALEFWKKHLTGATPCELPTDRPRPAVKSYRGGFVRTRISKSLVDRLRALSDAENVSLFSTLLTTLKVLLARYSGQGDISVLVPVGCRQRFSAESIIGYFANLVVLRVPVADRAPFRQLLREVNTAVVGGLMRQDVPFEKVIEAIGPARSLSHDPVGSVALSFLPERGSKLALPGVEAVYSEIPNGGSKFDLQFFIAEVGEELTFCTEYNRDIFDQATIDQLGAHYLGLLERVTAMPDAAVADLPILTESERARILFEWNKTLADYPRQATIPDLVRSVAARTPDAPAASFEGKRITYAELERRSNRIARALRKRGVGGAAGVRVGIAVERSLSMLEGLLGILKAGGAYLPLDPAYPRERLTLMAEDSGIGVLVSEKQLSDIVPCPSVLLLDADLAEIEAESDAPLDLTLDAEAIAYVIYTSGSTGKPKGVEIPHRAVANFLTSMAKRPGLIASDRVIGLTSLSFDIAGLELWLPLSVGAHVEIVSRETAGNGTALCALIETARINVIQATPSTFRLLLEAKWKGAPDLKVLVGGEATSRELADQLLDRARSVWNMYGPTETTVWSCVEQLQKSAPILIGRPIANTQAYVLDRNLGPVPPSVSGELYLGGDGVARGYLGRPELTAERFLTNPFTDGRIYRTGDRARFRRDGAIEFLGRADFQIKFRGHRIEPGEIEAQLVDHPVVREAVVVIWSDSSGDPKLVAYLTLNADAPTDAQQTLVSELRTHLRANLPEYMMPSIFMVIDALPLTANSKVDRKALPTPTGDSNPSLTGSASDTNAEPRDDVESKVAEIFREVLNLKRIGMSDNFFDSGGHSLLALRLISKIEKIFGQRLPMSVLLRSATIAEIAALVRAGGTTLSSSLVAIAPRGARPPVYWLPGGGGISVLAFRGVSELLGPNQPVYGLEARMDDPSSKGDLPTIAAQYIRDIQAFQPEGPYHLFGFSGGSWVAFEMGRILREAGHEVGLLVVFDTPCWIGAEGNKSDKLRIRLQREIYHFKNMPRSVSGMFGYAKDRVEYLGKMVAENGTQAGWTLARRALAKLGAPMPKMFMDVDKLNRQAIHSYATAYRPTPYDGRITTILARQTSMAGVDPKIDPRLGWRRLATKGLDVHHVSGTHLSMLEPPHVEELAAKLQWLLERAHRESNA